MSRITNLSFRFFSLIYRIFRTSCEFFYLINSTVAINSSKKSQSKPESLCIIKEKNAKLRLLSFSNLDKFGIVFDKIVHFDSAESSEIGLGVPLNTIVFCQKHGFNLENAVENDL